MGPVSLTKRGAVALVTIGVAWSCSLRRKSSAVVSGIPLKRAHVADGAICLRAWLAALVGMELAVVRWNPIESNTAFVQGVCLSRTSVVREVA
jgi:hypothetical protein